MKNLLGIVICLFCLFLSSSFAQKQTAKQKVSKSSARKKVSRISQANRNFTCDLPASVTALQLDQTEITLNCPADESCLSKKVINITTVAVDTGREKYIYTVSAGKIIGEGANVKWDLSGIKSGKYTITAAISQPVFNNTRWEVLGTTQTKLIIIKE